MFGPGDAFLTPLLAMLRRTPVFPMFGSGSIRLQPAYVEDVAEPVVRILGAPTACQLYELAGPRVYTYKELLRTIAASAGVRPFLVPFPFSLCIDVAAEKSSAAKYSHASRTHSTKVPRRLLLSYSHYSSLIGYVSEVLPNPPITRNQVELLPVALFDAASPLVAGKCSELRPREMGTSSFAGGCGVAG
jgi:nucleoside-diphosphate-sugar epimerase